METKRANDDLFPNSKVAVDDGSKSFDNFINSRLEMAKNKDKLISIEDLFANMRSKVGETNV